MSIVSLSQIPTICYGRNKRFSCGPQIKQKKKKKKTHTIEINGLNDTTNNHTQTYKYTEFVNGMKAIFKPL